ncbi:MAG: transposase [Candidatus Zixiibacteriota bacterium]
MSTKEVQQQIVSNMRRWQKIENVSVASTANVIENTENPIVRLVMEIIQRDSPGDPRADEQRCWCHKMRNVLAHFPKRLHPEVKRLLRRMYDAATKEQAETLMAQFAEAYGHDYPRAVECLLKDQDALLTFYRYPQQHWVSPVGQALLGLDVFDCRRLI